jgi:hypothetical protein
MALIVEIFYRYFKYEMLGDDEKLSDASVVFVGTHPACAVHATLDTAIYYIGP